MHLRHLSLLPRCRTCDGHAMFATSVMEHVNRRHPAAIKFYIVRAETEGFFSENLVTSEQANDILQTLRILSRLYSI